MKKEIDLNLYSTFSHHLGDLSGAIEIVSKAKKQYPNREYVIIPRHENKDDNWDIYHRITDKYLIKALVF